MDAGACDTSFAAILNGECLDMTETEEIKCRSN